MVGGGWSKLMVVGSEKDQRIMSVEL